MASNIYINILNRKIENFVKMFSNDSNKIFKRNDTDLIHPGEYGKYRERVCKDILRLVLKKNVDISDGFIITANNNISTQCDIIIYNANAVPLITDGIAMMFPVEEVKAIGEIKSNLSKKDFKDALRKMANNKKLQNDRRSPVSIKEYTGEAFDTIPTFLICNKLEFDYNNISLKEIYEDIPRKYWHNAILSIEDGFITYGADFKRGNENTVNKLQKKGLKMDKLVLWSYPYISLKDDTFETIPRMVKPKIEDKYYHIVDFFINISKLVKFTYTYEHDPIAYIDKNTYRLFKRKIKLTKLKHNKKCISIKMQNY